MANGPRNVAPRSVAKGEAEGNALKNKNLELKNGRNNDLY